MWGSARIVGTYDQRGNTRLADMLFPKAKAGFIPRDLPLENFGYQYYVGDYHPPLGGFFLLLLALAIMGALQHQVVQGKYYRNLQVLLALTVPAAIATNTWVFPLQVVLVGGWALWRQWLGRREPLSVPDWSALLAGGIGGFLLLYPFLSVSAHQYGHEMVGLDLDRGFGGIGRFGPGLCQPLGTLGDNICLGRDFGLRPEYRPVLVGQRKTGFRAVGSR
jgi:hypothetical protein